MARPKSTDRIADFWSKVKIGGEDECWEWQASFTGRPGNTYGQFWIEGRKWTVHRLAYTLEVGDIPEGLEVGHTCQNRHCANPRHLIAATHRDNQRRGQGASGVNARKTHCARCGSELSTLNDGTRKCLPCRRRQARERYRAKRDA